MSQKHSPPQFNDPVQLDLMGYNLHDVVEDCEVTPEKLRMEFGAEIASLVVVRS